MFSSLRLSSRRTVSGASDNNVGSRLRSATDGQIVPCQLAVCGPASSTTPRPSPSKATATGSRTATSAAFPPPAQLKNRRSTDIRGGGQDSGARTRIRLPLTDFAEMVFKAPGGGCGIAEANSSRSPLLEKGAQRTSAGLGQVRSRRTRRPILFHAVGAVVSGSGCCCRGRSHCHSSVQQPHPPLRCVSALNLHAYRLAARRCPALGQAEVVESPSPRGRRQPIRR